MSSETGTIDGGLSAPAKRGRQRKIDAGGNANAASELEGGKQEPIERTQDAPGGFPIIDPLGLPADAGAGDSRDGDRPRRGRRPGTKNRAKEEVAQNLTSLLKIEKILVSSAFFLGNIAGAPELHMSEEQAKDIREALEELCRLYPVGISEKKIAWINFSFAVGGWAGPALVAIAQRPAKPKPQVVPTPIRSEPAPQSAANGSGGTLPPVAGRGGDKPPSEALVPSEMWAQPGDIPDSED